MQQQSHSVITLPPRNREPSPVNVILWMELERLARTERKPVTLPRLKEVADGAQVERPR